MDLQAYLILFLNVLEKTVFPFILAIAFLVFMWNVVHYFIINGQNSDAHEKARSLAIWGISAFVVVSGIWGILNIFTTMLGLNNNVVTPDYIEYKKIKKSESEVFETSGSKSITDTKKESTQTTSKDKVTADSLSTSYAPTTETSILPQTQKSGIVSTNNLIAGIIHDPDYLTPSYGYFETKLEYISHINSVQYESAKRVQEHDKEIMLELPFLLTNNKTALVPNAEAILDDWIKTFKSAGVSMDIIGVLDEPFWIGTSAGDLEAQMETYRDLISMTRKKLPEARLAVAITPYTYFNNPNSKSYLEELYRLVDVVSTDPYIFAVPDPYMDKLKEWNLTFADTVRSQNSNAEVWLIIQAFGDKNWDKEYFKEYLNFQFEVANTEYDGVLFFGWFPYADVASQAGIYFDEDIKDLYRTFTNI